MTVLSDTAAELSEGDLVASGDCRVGDRGLSTVGTRKSVGPSRELRWRDYRSFAMISGRRHLRFCAWTAIGMESLEGVAREAEETGRG